MLGGVRVSAKGLHHQLLARLGEDCAHGKLINRVFQPFTVGDGKWFPPKHGGLRVDVDASVIGLNEAACGGVIRDARGRWVLGFRMKLGLYPIAIAEMLAIKEGISLCAGLQAEELLVCSDSVEAINLLSRYCGHDHPFAAEIEQARDAVFGGTLVSV